MEAKKIKSHNENQLIPGIQEENVYDILSFLDPKDLCKMRLLNKKFSWAATKPSV
jgi:hypothetical protein